MDTSNCRRFSGADCSRSVAAVYAADSITATRAAARWWQHGTQAWRAAWIPFPQPNTEQTYGQLRPMEVDERPGSRDVVLYESLPNELLRVAGVVLTVQQTPLSHVNLREIQDRGQRIYHRRCRDGKLSQKEIGRLPTFTGRGRFPRFGGRQTWRRTQRSDLFTEGSL